jgi:ferric-dicitrate binding protein FerR (iron transport regulator)
MSAPETERRAFERRRRGRNLALLAVLAAAVALLYALPFFRMGGQG